MGGLRKGWFVAALATGCLLSPSAASAAGSVPSQATSWSTAASRFA